MCSPMLALTIGSMAMSYVQGQSQAAAAGAAAANNAQAQYAQTAVQQQQINAAASQKSSERAKQALIEQGKLETISGESGVSGISADRLLGDSSFQSGTDIANIELNRANDIRQTQAAEGSAEAQAQSTSNIAAAKAPTLLSTGLQIGGAVATDPTLNLFPKSTVTPGK